MSKPHLITAALPYANGPIHIGHLLEYIQADIHSRFLKVTGHDALYICASDMHGAPIEINASKAGLPPLQFVEKYFQEHKNTFESFHIKFDNYYKTHSPENQELANYFFSQAKKKGFIHRATIKVVYCENCKRSLPDRYVKGTCPKCAAQDQYGDVCEKCSSILKGIDLLNPYCSICKSQPITKDSEHYFFKLGNFARQLREWINNPESYIQDEIRNWLMEWLDKGLDDWCISRDGPYFGFEIPGAEQETGEKKYFYVWLDAPIGYISSTKNLTDRHNESWERYWKEGIVHHHIGKDIIYFHFLFWPALLMAVGIPLPRLTVHGFITVDGQKMSKSRGTFFTAHDFLALFPAEALRFYYASHLDRNLVDVDLSLADFQAVNNNVLLGNLANFCYRVLTFASKNYGVVDQINVDKATQLEADAFIAEIKDNYSHENYRLAIKNILRLSDLGNSLFQKATPWKTKENTDTKAVVGFCINLARNLSIICSPILPLLGDRVQYATFEKNLLWKDISFTWKGKLREPVMLAQKIENIPAPNVASTVQVNYSVDQVVTNLGVKVAIAQIDHLSITKKKEPLERFKKQVEQDSVATQSFIAMQSIIDGYDEIDSKTGVNSAQNPNAVRNLIRLVREKGKLPQINSVVDVYNTASIQSGICMATHDLAKIEGNVTIRLSQENELFTSLDGTVEKLRAGEAIYADDKKVLGRFSKQCQQSATTISTKSVLLVCFGNNKINQSQFDESVRKTCDLITSFNGGSYTILSPLANSVVPLDLAVGKIIDVKDHPQAEKLFILEVDFSTEKRQVVSGLKGLGFNASQLLNTKAVFLMNLKVSVIRGVTSQAMMLTAEGQGKIVPLQLDSAIGAVLSFQNTEPSKKEITIQDFAKITLVVKNHRVCYNEKVLIVNKNEVLVPQISEGKIS